VWVLKIILFNCVYGFFIDAVVFCDDVLLIVYFTLLRKVIYGPSDRAV
jgi:hypothetical protein